MIVVLAKIFLGFFTSLSTYYNDIVSQSGVFDDSAVEYDLHKKVVRIH